MPTAILEAEAGQETGSDPFALDLTVLESAIPITTLLCSTGDGCGSSCCSSACTTAAADPFALG